MRKSACGSEEGGEGLKLNRGTWTVQEDKLLISCIQTHGQAKWTLIPKRAGLKRSAKSCRLRWLNYLRPDIKRGGITPDEEQLIIRLHNLLGNRWSLIAGRLPGRTDNEIKNYWNTTLVKKLRTRQPCPIPEEQDGTISYEPDEDVVTQPGVIHAKAGRCKNVVIQDPRSPKDKSLAASNEPQINEAHPTATVVPFSNQGQGSHGIASESRLSHEKEEHNSSDHVNLRSAGIRNDDEFLVLDQLNVADFCSYFNLDELMDLDMALKDGPHHLP